MEKNGEPGSVSIMAVCSSRIRTYGEVSAAKMISSEIPRFSLMIVSPTYEEIWYVREENGSYDPRQTFSQSELDTRRTESLW
jgi:hypothetical protein